MAKSKSKLCRVDGCRTPAGMKDFCIFHEDTHELVCIVDGCERPQWANGYCMKCNRQTDRTGKPKPTKRYTAPDAKPVLLRLSRQCREVLATLGNGSAPRKGVEILEDYAKRHAKQSAA